MKRMYKSGTQWCYWRWTEVIWESVLYLVRLHILKGPRRWTMLHWILQPDPHPDPHDHPGDFISITLWGGYTEEVYRAGNAPHGAPIKLVTRRKRIKFISAKHIHKIIAVDPGTLTLVFGWYPGGVSRVWGFHTQDGFVPWKEYRKDHK